MKNTIRCLLSVLITILFLGISCEKEPMEKGFINVRLTDAPAVFSAVNVNIISVQVNYDDQDEGAPDGWLALDTETGIYDLLELRNGISRLIAEDELPAGKLKQLRMILGYDNTLVMADDTLDLMVPGSLNTGIKINVNDSIMPNKNLEITLDFDADSSVVVQGNGNYLLKPVIKVNKTIHTDPGQENNK